MNEETLINKVGKLLEENKLAQAKKLVLKELELIPVPKYAYEQAQILYLMLGDILYYQDQPYESLDAFVNASLTPLGNMHPFINLRIAQNYLELKLIDRTKEYLVKMHEIANYDLLEDEDAIFKEILDDTLSQIEQDIEENHKVEMLIDQSLNFWQEKNYDACLDLLNKAWLELDEPKYENPMSYMVVSGAIECCLCLKDTTLINKWLDHLKMLKIDESSNKSEDLLYAKVYYQLNELDKAYDYFDSYYKLNGSELLDIDDQIYLKFYLEKREVLSFKS